MVTYEVKNFKNLDKWLTAGFSLETELHLRNTGNCWELLDITGELFGQMYVGGFFTGRTHGWLCVSDKISA
jgi:hypothetical protein